MLISRVGLGNGLGRRDSPRPNRWRRFRRQQCHLEMGKAESPSWTVKFLILYSQAFYINLLIGAIFSPIFFLYIPNIDLQKGSSFREKSKQLDPLGIVLFFGFIVCMIMAINFGGSVFAWNSASEIILIVFTGVLFIAFILTEHFHPFIPFKNRLYPMHFQKRLMLFNVQVQLLMLSGIMLVRNTLPWRRKW